MKALFSKNVVAAAIATSAMFAGASAQAVTVYPDFRVQPQGPTVTKPFTADRIGGGYQEIANFTRNSPTATSGTFNVSLRWSAAEFFKDSETGGTGLNSKTTGLGFDYGLYALYTASGTFAQNDSGDIEFFYSPGTGGLSVYLDANLDTEFVQPGDGTTLYGTVNGIGDDDVLLATGQGVNGYGLLDPNPINCGEGGLNCGSFGSTTTFKLNNPAGSNFFIEPEDFYNLSFQSGNLNNFNPFVEGPQVINGLLNVTFNNAAEVPEPASLGLLGLGLLGLSAMRRRKQVK